MRLLSTLAIVVALAPCPAVAQEAGWPMPIHDDQVFWMVLAEQAELAVAGDANAAVWDVQGWLGTDFDRLWIKSEGERATDSAGGELEIQALYSRLVSPYWDLQAGVRYERQFGAGPSRDRVHLALGVQGLAPYWFEMEPVLFISEDGDVAARIEGSYDLLLTQRLILQPDFELDLALQSVEEWGVGSGINELSLALRMRYEIRRELAPYIGVIWSQKYGETADLARREGSEIRELAWLAGCRFWF